MSFTGDDWFPGDFDKRKRHENKLVERINHLKILASGHDDCDRRTDPEHYHHLLLLFLISLIDLHGLEPFDFQKDSLICRISSMSHNDYFNSVAPGS